MAYSIDKKTGEITFGGFSNGIATSPHTGIADMKCLNIASIPGEVQVSYNRIQQSQTSTSGSVTFNATNVITHTGNDVLNGTVITISGSADGTIVNGDYWVTRVSSSSFKLSTNVTNFLAGTFVTAAGSSSASYVTINMGQPNAWAATNSSLFPNYQYFVNDTSGRVWYSAPSNFTGWTLLENSTNNASGLFCFNGYLFQCQSGTTNALRYKNLGSFGTSWTAFKALNTDISGVNPQGLSHFSLVSHNGTAYICDGSYIDSLAPVGGSTFDPTNSATYTWTSKALTIALNDSAISIGEIASGSLTSLLIGSLSNVIYPWDGLSTTYGALIYLPESKTVQIVTVNNLAYIFGGSKGNIYVTNGSSVSPVVKIPDYIANNTGVNQDPYFIWGGVMYLRGRVWFSVQATNCGGIWSFVPTASYYLPEESGASLRCEHQNSYGTYSGYATVLFPNLNYNGQQSNGPQFWAGWDNGSSVYGIDYSDTVAYTGGSIIETDLVPTGTLLEKKTFKQLEYKLSSPLATNESIQLYYRLNLTDSFTSCGTVIQETSNKLSGYFTVAFQSTQNLQLKAVLTSTTSSPSWCRLTNLYVR